MPYTLSITVVVCAACCFYAEKLLSYQTDHTDVFIVERLLIVIDFGIHVFGRRGGLKSIILQIFLSNHELGSFSIFRILFHRHLWQMVLTLNRAG